MPTATLADCVQRLVGELRDVSLSTTSPDMAAVLKRYLASAQRSLWLEHEWPGLRATVTFPTVANQRAYAYPSGVSQENLLRIRTKYQDTIYPVQHAWGGEPLGPVRLPEDPARMWWIDATNDTTPIVIYPTPATASQTIMVDYQKELGPFANDADTSTLDAEAIVLFAAAELAAARGLPDVPIKIEKAKTYLDRLRSRIDPRGGRVWTLAYGGRRDWRANWEPRVR